MTKGKDGKKDRNKNRHSPDVQSLGQFKTWIKPQGSNIFSFPPLAIETDRYGKILFQNMQVLLITRLSAIDPGQLNKEQFAYMHVIDKQPITFQESSLSLYFFTHKLPFVPSKYSTSIEQQMTTYILQITGNWSVISVADT